jgi:sulfite reductase (NADPH) flavoprotein alpha-component
LRGKVRHWNCRCRLTFVGGRFLVWSGLAMAWRRLRYRKREAGALLNIEAMTTQVEITPGVVALTSQVDKIQEDVLRIDMEETNSIATNGYCHNGHLDARTGWSAAPYNAESALIVYGSVTGNAESLASRLAAILRAAGITARVRDMAHCQPSVLTQATYLFMVVSTYGDGEPPEDAVPFWQAVVHGNGLDLCGVKYSVLALGNTTFDHFCKCGRDFDAALECHGATRIYPRVDCDVDYDAPAKEWLDGIMGRLVEDKQCALSA